MHRNVFSLITVRLTLATLLLTLCATETFGQLDERWSVTINGQTVRVEPDGSFLLSNVSAPDLFGPGGPGTPADNFADDVYRLTGVRTTGSGTLYVYSPNAVRIRPDDKFTFSLDSLTVTPFAPPLPESVVLQVGCDPSAPTECGPVFAVGKRRALTVTATLTDGTQQDVTLPSVWTTYRTSNVNIARIVGDNADLNLATTIDIEGISPGVAFITATNTGATSVVKIIVANPANLISTTVEGFVRNAAGFPVSGASVTVKLSGGASFDPGTTDATGFFFISSITLPDTSQISAEATFTAPSLTESGSSVSVTPVANGITDVGIITIDVVCNTPWSTAFGPTTFNGPDIFAMAVFDDDGLGPNPPTLFVGGRFDMAGGTPANNIAKWNGQAWEPLVDSVTTVDGVNEVVNSLAVLDLNDGNGPALYAAGGFVTAGGAGANKIARWDGTNWSSISGNGGGVGLSHDSASAIAAFDDGTGNGTELYVGGSFAVAGLVVSGNMCLPANGCVDAYSIAKWTGSTWLPVGVMGINTGPVNALAVFDDDGAGSNPPLLYIGGQFFLSGTPNTRNMAKWDGVSLSGVGYNGLPGFFGNRVTSLTVFDDGSGIGTALYAGGQFVNPLNFGNPDPVTVNLRNIARWDGSAWSALGSSFDNDVLALAGVDDGVNKILYASGRFDDVNGGGVGLKRVAQWDGTAWSQMGTGIETTGTALGVFDDGTGPSVYVGGAKCVSGCIGFSAARSSEPNRSPSRLSTSAETVAVAAVYQGFVTKWQTDEWFALSKGHNGEVRALTVFDDDGSGANPPALYAGGAFTPPLGPRDDNPAPFPTNAIAKFDGMKWSSLGVGLTTYDPNFPPNPLPSPASLNTLAIFDEDGAGVNAPVLFAGGDFVFADGLTANNVARWDGVDWSAVGTVGGIVEALAVFDDDGAGPNPSALYAGGVFSGGIKMWDGAAWTTFGGAVTGSVFAEAVFNGELYIGGSFSDAGGVGEPGFLARWDGSAWSAVGSGVNGSVYALTVFDDGTGPALYVGGEFLLPVAVGITANRVAKWNGSMWSAMGSGLGPNPGTARVDTLAAFDNGQGERLYAGGDFTTTSGVAVNRIAKWTGVTWLPVGVSSLMGSDPGGGVDGTGTVAVQALAVFDDGTNGPALFVGGAFESAAGSPSSNIAKLGCR